MTMSCVILSTKNHTISAVYNIKDNNKQKVTDWLWEPDIKDNNKQKVSSWLWEPDNSMLPKYPWKEVRGNQGL